MLKVHHLSPESLKPLGYHSFSPMTFKNCEELPHYMMDKADVVSIPLPLRPILDDSHRGVHMDRHGLKKIIKHFKLDERRVAAYDCSDWTEDYSGTNPNCIFIRCSAKGWYVRSMPRTISWPWPVEDWKEVIPMPEGGFKYDISGHMWLSHETRINACDSVKATFGDRADIVTRREFWGYLERDEPARAMPMKAAMKASMQASRVSLCPASIPNVFPYRFFEAMSSGRVPALFCSDYVLPFGKKIDYKSCCIMMDDYDAKHAGPMIKNWLSKHSDQEIVEMGLRGRAYFERYLHRDRFSELWTEAVTDLLKFDGMLT